MLRVSYSGGKLFEECPARWRAEHIDGHRSLSSIEARVGTFLHKVAEEYVKHLMRSQQSQDLNYSDRLFEQLWDSREQAEIPEGMHEEILHLWNDTAKELFIANVDQVVEAELPLAFMKGWHRCEWDDQRAWLRMKIDRLDVDGAWNATIWDLKTGRKIDTSDGPMQGKVYAAGVMAAFPKIQSLRFNLLYPRYGVTRSYEMKPSDIEEGQRWIYKITQSLELAWKNNEWKAIPGSACMECPVFATCETRKRRAPRATVRLLDEAMVAAERLMTIERERKDLTAMLKDWVAANGPLEIHGMIAGYSVAAEYEFPIEGVLAACKAKGLDPISVLKPDNKKIERLARKDDRFREMLDAVKIDCSTTRFGIKKGES